MPALLVLDGTERSNVVMLMFTSFGIRTFLVGFFAVVAVGSTIGSEPMPQVKNVPLQAFFESMQWCNRLKSFELEVSRHEDSQSDHKISDKNTNPEASIAMHDKWVDRLELRCDAATNKSTLAAAFGNSSMKIKVGGNVDFKDVASSQIAIVVDQNCYVREIGGSDDLPVRMTLENGIGLLSRATRMDSSVLPFAFYPVKIAGHDRSSQTVFLVDYLIDNKDTKNVMITDAKTKEGKPVKVARIKRLSPSEVKGAAAWRVVISDEGVDKGLIVEAHQCFLKEDQLGEVYAREDQLKNVQVSSTFVTWKSVPLDDGGESIVLPASVKRQASTRYSTVTLKTELIDFRWVSLKAPEPEKLTDSFAEKRTWELRKAVDKALNR
jgi:hypothetical protein